MSEAERILALEVALQERDRRISEGGSRFVERVLTAVTTLRQQKRNVLEYLTQACEAVLFGRPAPSLLPQSTPQPTSLAA
jgi:transposase